jgi:hypothetical protein
MLARYSSSIRTGCANERPSGSVRGAPGRPVSLPRSPTIVPSDQSSCIKESQDSDNGGEQPR